MLLLFGYVFGSTFMSDGVGQVLEAKGGGHGSTPGIGLIVLPLLGFCSASKPLTWSVQHLLVFGQALSIMFICGGVGQLFGTDGCSHGAAPGVSDL